MQNTWFQVDKQGLAKIIDEKGKSMVLFELIQNAWDTGATRVDVDFTKLAGRPAASLVVRDNDPRGFAHLEHAYTLFAESEKKGDATKRGFMNLGEKLVLALCRSASVVSTTGSVHFHEDGTMTKGRTKSAEGSVFTAEIKMTQAEFDEAVQAFWTLIPPSHCSTYLNGVLLLAPEAITTFECALATRIADADGYIRTTKRLTKVEVYAARQGEEAAIYEMGIPVVTTGDKYLINVLQKVPVNMNRDNVPPAYLRKLRAEVLNRTANLLTKEDAQESWVTNALEDEAVQDEAVVQAVERRFGKHRVIYDPTDVEAGQNAVSKGYTVMHGGSLPAAAWEAVRRSGAAKPAGQVLPTPRPYSTDPNAPERPEIPRSEWTRGMREVEEITRWFAKELGVHTDLRVMFVKIAKNYVATWGNGFEWNVSCHGAKWFEEWYKHPTEMLDTILHEFAHDEANSHLDDKFHKACTRNGSRAMMLMYTRAKEIPHFKRVKEWIAG